MIALTEALECNECGRTNPKIALDIHNSTDYDLECEYCGHRGMVRNGTTTLNV